MIEYQPLKENIEFICDNLRPLDWSEISADMWQGETEDLVAAAMYAGPNLWLFGDEDGPISCLGAVENSPKRYTVFMFATPLFNQIWRPVTRRVVRVIMPELINQGLRRAECRSLDEHTPAHRWLEFLGAKFEGVARSHGKAGQDFYQYAWTRDDVLARVKQDQ